MTAAQIVLRIVREQILPRKSALLVEVPTILQKKVSKESERKRKNPVQLVNRTADVQNARLVNVLDADLKIIQLQNARNHQKITINGKSSTF